MNKGWDKNGATSQWVNALLIAIFAYNLTFSAARAVTNFSDTQLPTMEEYLKTLIAKSDYILLDPRDASQLTPVAVRLAEADPGLKPVAHDGNTTLWRRAP